MVLPFRRLGKVGACMSPEFELVSKILNGGGMLALSLVVWLELRRLTAAVRSLELHLIEAVGKVESRQRQTLERLREAGEDSAEFRPPRRPRTRRESD